MKNLMKYGFMAALMGSVIFTSCDTNEIIIPDPTSEFDGELVMTEGGGDQSINISVDANTQSTVKLRVAMTSTASMKRLYITQNVGGQGAEAFELIGTDNKLDGSLNMAASEANAADYILTLDVPSGVEGTIVYDLWTTSGRGDHRDVTKRLVVGVGSVTLNYGGANPAAAVKTYTAKILGAPRNDLASESFISLRDGTLYKISDGVEYAAFWDFGYFYGADKASLASTSAYEAAFGSDANGVPFIDVDVIAGTTELNNAYFSLSTMDFASVAVSGDLSAISQATNQKINNLAVGDIVEFVDNYGKKGLIEVVTIYLGASGNGYDSDAYIEINIKVQP
ncbi:MAG: hypothetical protein OEX22_01800 [Cyclobacteriaceae bacterium]|nr:hypothetical protein [Cyclobacteriaceae bacterium]